MSDLISRQDAIEAIRKCDFGSIMPSYWHQGLLQARQIIEALPSAEPKTGEWIPNHDGSWNCSECGLRVLVYAKGNYCPNCGAIMKGGDSE